MLAILLIIAIPFSGITQNRYRIKKTEGHGYFIYPPKAKLKFKKKGGLREGCKYHYIYIDFLKLGKDGDYYDILENLNKAEYFSWGKDFKHICFDWECGEDGSPVSGESKGSLSSNRKRGKIKIKKKCKKVNNEKGKGVAASRKKPYDKHPVGSYAQVKYSYDERAFLLQIDYEKLLNDNGKTVEESFFELAKDLLIEFSKKERKQTESYDWPIGISQSIVEKIFELIPVPNEASLARYYGKITEDGSSILLSPKIKLKVDLTGKHQHPEDESIFNYGYLGQSTLEFNRDSTGYLRQNAFYEFQNNVSYEVPGNYIVQDKVAEKTIHIQSSASDLQLSFITKDKSYTMLYMDFLKRNNSTSNRGDGNYNDADKMLYKGNGILLLSDSIRKLCSLTRANYLQDPDLVKSVIGCDSLVAESSTSVFGCRPVMTPLFTIMLNGEIADIIVNTRKCNLYERYSLPYRYKMYRIQKGKLVRFKKPRSSIILLPGDHITY